MRWTYATIEWSSFAVSRAFASMEAATHFVLPDLPLATPKVQPSFVDLVPHERRIQTIAAASYSKRSLTEHVEQFAVADHFLVVGGNGKGNGTLTTLDAIQTVRSANPLCTIWAVSNPNCQDSIDSVCKKLEKGASGIMTQPLLHSTAVSTLQKYPCGVDYIAGLALPKSEKSLNVWVDLLEQPDLPLDPLFQEHKKMLRHYRDIRWGRSQLDALSELDQVRGIHYMPFTNVEDLLVLLQEEKHR